MDGRQLEGGVPFDAEGVDVERLDRRFLAEVRGEAESPLPIVGYGEVSVTFAWPPEDPGYAVKCLPPFDSEQRLEHYVRLLEDYVEELRCRGIDVVPTAVRTAGDATGWRGYCVQPLLDTATVVPAVLAASPRASVRNLLERIVATTAATVDDHVGLDCQASNWAWADGGLRYLDVTTPMLRDADGRDRLDVAPLIGSLPWLLRGAVGRWVVPGLLAPYHDLRAGLLDLAGNLHRHHLADLVPLLLDVANPRISPPLSEGEVARFYRRNARTWGTLQRLRRMDRAWQRHVRGRTYPYLMPRTYER
jgi:hypothetical protein